MKVPSILRVISVSFALVVTLFFMSCTKDSAINSDNTTSGRAIMGPIGVTDQTDVVKTGAAFVQVLPLEANPVMTLFNERYSTNTFKTDGAGNYYFFNIPAGIYTLYVHPLNAGYSDYKVGGLEIKAGQKTDLGTIILQ
jgi:hypothetical protein